MRRGAGGARRPGGYDKRGVPTCSSSGSGCGKCGCDTVGVKAFITTPPTPRASVGLFFLCSFFLRVSLIGKRRKWRKSRVEKSAERVSLRLRAALLHPQSEDSAKSAPQHRGSPDSSESGLCYSSAPMYRDRNCPFRKTSFVGFTGL